MGKSKKAKMRERRSALAKRAYPQSVSEHAKDLEQEFSNVNKQIRNPKALLSETFKKHMKTGIQSAVDASRSKGVIAHSPSKEGRKAFEDLVLAKICYKVSGEMAASVPEAMFVSLRRSFQHLIPKIQALQLASQHSIQHPAESIVINEADQDADTLLSAQAAKLSVDYEIADSTDDKSSADEKETSKQVVQPAIRLQGSVDFIPDGSDSKSDEESGEDYEVGIKEESENEAEALVPMDPTVFTITLGIPTAVDDHRFSIRFNNKRVVDGLSCMPSREIWQLVHDAIQHDPNIPNRSSSLPRITDVLQQDDKSLAFKTKTQGDLHTVTTNVQWVRNIRDTISAGMKTYKVVFEYTKIWKMKTEEYRDRASIIDKIREENLEKMPSLNQVGAIRDVMMLRNPAFKRKRDGYADYVLVFGSREAANAALEMGLMFRKKHHLCLIYEPGTQWHQQCSHCQGHSHTAKDCQSTPLCGRCGYKRATHYCTCATIECANCHGEHVASSKKCPKWLKAEEEAHRSYRFPAEDTELQIPAPAKPAPATLPPPMLPLPMGQNAQETLNEKPGIAPQSSKPPQATSTHPSVTLPPPPSSSKIPLTTKPQPQPQPPTPSALLQTIDEFRAFVAARENAQISKPKKRKEPECVMAGALQDTDHDHDHDHEYERDGKRVKVKREEEGPVWPIGQVDYRPPSLRVRGLGG